MIRRHIREYLQKIHQLLNAKDAPHAVAGGIAIGIFFGFIPIFGFKLLGAMGLSMMMRCSVIAAMIGTSLHDIFLPIWPLILRYQYQIGFWILSKPHHFAPRLSRAGFKFSEIFQWDSFIDIGFPLLLGGFILAIPISLLSYVVIFLIMKKRATQQT